MFFVTLYVNRMTQFKWEIEDICTIPSANVGFRDRENAGRS
jgi:hypothetical protein